MSRLLLPVSTVLAAIAWTLFSWQALISIHKRWWTWGETYEIGYPLLGIALFWTFLQRDRLRAAELRPSRLGAALFLATLLLSSAARLVQLQIVQQLMVPVSLWCGLFAVLGWRRAAILFLPCALLLGGIPIWDFLVDPLRMLTVWAVQNLLELLKIPALVQGYQVVLPAGLIKIEDACSGLNLLLAALVLSILQAEVSLPHSSRKWLVIALGIVVGIVDNWVRVFGLVAIAYYSDMKSSLVHDHISFGWWLFVASLVPFFLAARVIERSAGRSPVRDSSDFLFAPLQWHSGRDGRRSAAIACLSIALFSGSLYLLTQRIERRVDQIVPGFNEPAGAQVWRSGWLPQYSGFDAQRTWRRKVGGREYDIAALLYRRQQPGRKLIYYRNRIAAAEDIATSSTVLLPSGVKLNNTVIRGREWRAVWWYYWIDGAVATEIWRVKLLQLKALLFGAPNAALVTLSIACREPGCAQELAAPEATALAVELSEGFEVVRRE